VLRKYRNWKIIDFTAEIGIKESPFVQIRTYTRHEISLQHLLLLLFN